MHTPQRRWWLDEDGRNHGIQNKARMPGVMERVLGGVHSNLLANAESMIKLLSM